MDVRSAMTPNPAACSADTPLREVARLMRDNDCGQIPVVDAERRPLGVVTDRDIVVRTIACGDNALTKTAGDVMTTPAVTVSPEMTLVECCDVMEREQIRRVPVVGESGRLIGIVALADVAQHAGRRTTAEVVKEVSQPNGNG